MSSLRPFQFGLWAALFLTFSSSTAAAVPLQLAHHGSLFDSAGEPLTGSVAITFSLWDEAEDGSQVWSEIRSVDVVDGMYSTLLGSENDVSAVLRAEPALWLQLEIAGETLLPRHPVASSPYAIVADTAVNVDGGTVNATSVTVGGTEVIDGAGSWTGGAASVSWASIGGVPGDLTDGDADTLGGLSCSGGDRAVWDDGSALWVCGADAVALARLDTNGAGAGDVLTFDGTDVGWASPGGSSATVYQAEDLALAPGAALAVNAAVASADLVAQAWVADTGGDWVPVAQADGSLLTASCSECGTGADGLSANYPFANGNELTNEYNFTSFDVPGTVTFVPGTGSQPVVIRAQESVAITGVIDFDGASGVGTTAGTGRAGGYSGAWFGFTWATNGTQQRVICRGSPGGGPGASPTWGVPSYFMMPGAISSNVVGGVAGSYTLNNVPAAWTAYGHIAASAVHGGSGGSSPCILPITSTCNSGPGAGAGGGAIAVVAPSIVVTGTLRSVGGTGGTAALGTAGTCPNYTSSGGSGSGGAVWLRGARVEVSGTINVGNGVIRIDAHEVDITGTLTGTVVYGSTEGLPPLFDLRQPTPGTVSLTNNSGTSRAARVVVVQ